VYSKEIKDDKKLEEAKNLANKFTSKKGVVPEL
jgi:hypothetical protein